ncbi:hypothetical protein IJ090_01090 [Candidatus Saccharibacteria bacterium]|nr:hypothetical protein [Candidatus Saccharibacteria bacterium]
MENKNSRDVVCKYKDANVFVMTCEEEVETPQATAEVQPGVAESEPQVVETIVEQVDTEEVAVPIVGDTSDEGYVEPLGETESWYPDTVNYGNVVNYEYGTSAEYVASLTNPEEGITASDIVLVGIIALSCLAIVGSMTVLTGRAVKNRALRKDFIKK